MNESHSKSTNILPLLFVAITIVVLSYVWSKSAMQGLTVQKTRFFFLMSALMLSIFVLTWFKHHIAVLIFVLAIPCLEFSRIFINTKESAFVPENILIIFLFFIILKETFIRSQYTVPMIAYVVLVLVSLLSVPDNRRWELFYIGYILPLIYFIVLREWLRTQHTKLIYLIPLSVAAASWPMFYFSAEIGRDLGSLLQAVIFARGGIGNSIVGLIILFLPLLLALKKFTANKWLMLIINVSLVLFAFSIQLSLNRGILFILLPLIFLFYWYDYISFRQIIALVIIVLIGNFAFGYVDLIVTRVYNLSILDSERWEMIQTYLKIIADLPLTGIGLGNFYASPHTLSLEFEYNSPCHNLFTYIAAETGIPSLIALLWMVVIFCRQSIECIRRSQDAKIVSLSRSILIGMVSYLIYANITGAVLVEENLTMVSATGMYMFVSMLLLQENLYRNYVVCQIAATKRSISNLQAFSAK